MSICAFLYTNKGFLKFEGALSDPSDDYDPNAPVVRMEPQHRSIVPDDPVITLKKETPKPAKKQDVSQFSSFYYENAEDPPRKGRTSILTLRRQEEDQSKE